MKAPLLGKAYLGAALLLIASVANAQAVSALKGHNSNAPVDFSADRIELQDRADRAVLSGNVDVTQGDMRLNADRVTIAYNSAGRTQVNRMVLNLDTGFATLDGGAVAGGKGGRVTGRFTPPPRGN